jgi:membrane-bound lytic murein transglycosylase MltF
MSWRETTLSAQGAVGASLALFFSILFSPTAACPSEKYKNITEYDAHFLRYSNQYFGPQFDWRYFKAQAIVESKLKPNVQAQDGAMGIMQIRPRTFREITHRNPHIQGHPKQPQWSIAAGIYYNRVMWDEWQEPVTVLDRLNFMLASYNAGKSNIVRAQQMAASVGLNPNSWKSIETALPQVTGQSGQATVAYVRKVNHTWMALQ